MSDLQLEGDNVTRPAFYNFTDYLDLLNERIHAIRDIVKTQHNRTIEKRLHKHGSERPSLRSFNEGDIVYCHFPSKTPISRHNLPSKKMKMNYVDPLFIFSKHNKFMYLLATINGEVIEQLFHVSHLKKGLQRLPNGRTVKTISDYKVEMIRSANDTKGKDDTMDLVTSNS